jgi:hypothetical protein
MPHAEIKSAGTDEMLDNGTQDQALNNEASNSIPAINEARLIYELKRVICHCNNLHYCLKDMN